MANESTFALISDVLPDIWEAALFYAQHAFVMPSVVRTFTDQTGFVPRKNTLYIETGVEDNLAETADLTTVPFDRDLRSTLTPKEIGKQFIITDRRVESDLEDVMADAALDIGYTIGKQLETDLLARFTSFELTQGLATTDMSTGALMEARALLEANAVPGPYTAVIHTYQYLDIFSDFTALATPAPLDIRNTAVRNYYVTQYADLRIIVSSLLARTVINEVQSITTAGSSAGTFTLTFNGQTTGAIAFDAANTVIQTALEALSNINVGDVTVASATEPWIATFAGQYAGRNVPEMTIDGGGLTGGTPAVTTTTQGSASSTAGVFGRDAQALDMRRGLRIEPDRDPSQRWTELNATMVYAEGGWRPERGVQLLADSTAPFS